MSTDSRPAGEVLLHGEETGSAFSVTEIVVPPRSPGPPLHRHDFAEAFYVLDGELVFQVEDERMTRAGGGFCFAPRNAVHTLANHGVVPARYLLTCAPSGFERQWARAAAEAAGVPVPAWATGPVPEVSVVGPPMPMSMQA